MKKILHVITRLDRGGSPEDTLYTCLHLRRQGLECAVIYGSAELAPENLMKQAADAGVKFILAPGLVRSVSPLKDITAFLQVFSIIKREKPDIIHTHTSKAGIIGRWAAWLSNSLGLTGAKIVHSTHGHVFYGYYNRFVSSLFVLIEKFTAAITDRITVLTDNEITETLSYGIGRRGLFTVIHSGIEYRPQTSGSGLRQKLSIAQDTVIIGSAGRLDPVKGYVDFVNAAKLVLDKAWPGKIVFLLTGDGIQMPLVGKMVRELGISGNFILSGWQNNVEDYIQACDIYVQPSINEGLGKTILMAQMLGRPIVATRVQGIVSLIEHGKTGLLANPRDPADLAEKIVSLLGDPQQKKMLGENAKHWVYETDPLTGNYRFSVEQMNALYSGLYRSL